MTPRWAGRRVCVAGIGVSGAAAALALRELGADVVAVDAKEGPAAAELRAAGCELRVGTPAAEALPAGVDLVVTSPGWRPSAPLLVAAAGAGLEVWGEVELAWRLRGPHAAPWLALTGTNGKTTTVGMLASMLEAAGHRTAAVGNVGAPIVAAVRAEPAYDVLAVELSSFQLHWTQTVTPLAGAVLNVAEDHLDWHGSMAAYAQDKAAVFRGEAIAVFNADDPWSTRLAAASARRIGFTLDQPIAGQLGVVAGMLVDRACADAPVELAAVADVPLPGTHNVANALAAAALARAYGVPAESVRDGLRGYAPGGHRNELVATVGGVAYVDDSKATNPHAAAASLAAYPSVVWVAGGLLKGAAVDELVRAQAPRLRGVVLLGRDRALIRAALARHAPNVPVVEVVAADTGAVEVMTEVVRRAAAFAQPGDTVLLAPAAASMDMFASYAERGDAFAVAARGLGGKTP